MLMLQYTCNKNEHAEMLAKNNESGNEEMTGKPAPRCTCNMLFELLTCARFLSAAQVNHGSQAENYRFYLVSWLKNVEKFMKNLRNTYVTRM